MRLITVLGLLALASCAGSNYHELPHTSTSDPVWQLNPGKWAFNENALTQPPKTASAGALVLP